MFTQQTSVRDSFWSQALQVRSRRLRRINKRTVWKRDSIQTRTSEFDGSAHSSNYFHRPHHRFTNVHLVMILLEPLLFRLTDWGTNESESEGQQSWCFWRLGWRFCQGQKCQKTPETPRNTIFYRLKVHKDQHSEWCSGNGDHNGSCKAANARPSGSVMGSQTERDRDQSKSIWA